MLALVLALVLPATELRLDPQVATWLELDTNAKRIPSGSLDDDGTIDPERPDEAVVGDGLLRTEGSLSAEARRERFTLRSDTAAGVKLFFTQPTERMAVVQSRGTVTSSELPLGLVATMSALGKGRGQLSGARTYALLRSDASLERALPARFAVRAGAAGQAFHAFDNALFSFTEGALTAGGRWQPTSGERIDLGLELGMRGYPFASRDPGADEPPAERRRDVVGVGSLSLTSARKIFLNAGYALVRNASNARAESYTRHRLSALLGFRLPERITCSAQGALQLTQYDDGVSLGQRYFLGDDEESQNVLEVQLSRPLLGGLSLEARASFMGNELAVEGARFSRQTAGIGLRAEL